MKIWEHEEEPKEKVEKEEPGERGRVPEAEKVLQGEGHHLCQMPLIGLGGRGLKIEAYLLPERRPCSFIMITVYNK